MTVDSRDFRKALGGFAAGVTVIATLNEAGAPVGVTVSAFTSVSLDPPLTAFCLGRNSALLDLFQSGASGGKFVVNVLAAGQEGVSNHFSSRQHQADWSEIASVPTASGVPALAGAVSTIECTRESVVDGGDHIVVIGRVTGLTFDETAEPLVYFRGRYGRFVPV